MKRLLAVAALALPLTARPAVPEKKPISFEDLWAVRRIGGPAVSPDGRLAAFTVTAFSVEEDRSDSDLWLVPVDGSAPPRRLTWNVGSDGGPQWSPDGTRLAFISKRGDKPPQLYVLPLAGGEAEPVTDLPVAAGSPRWLPDGRGLVFVASTWPDLDADFAAVKKRKEEREKDKVGAIVTENRLVRAWDRYVTDGSVPHLYLLDLESRTIRDLLPGSSRLGGLEDTSLDYDLSPDGSEIAFSANATDPPYRTMQADVFTVPVAGGPVRNLTAANPADDERPRYSPDGTSIVYGRTRRPDWPADFRKLARLDRATGAITDLAQAWDAAPGDWSFTGDGETLLFHADERGRVGLYALPVTGGTPRPLILDGATGGARAAAGGRVVHLAHGLTRLPELHVVGVDGTGARPLTALNAEIAARISLPTVEDVVYPGARGAPVQMFVLRPPGFDPGKTWPAVVLLHGGPFGAFNDEFHFRWNAALFASRGYVVALPNFHGSTGFGQAFADAIVGAHGDRPLADVLGAVDHLVARASVDPGRIGLAGGSYGGYLTNWVLANSDRFAAGIVHAGPYDLMGQFASDATWGRAAAYGAEPWVDPARIDLWSPSRKAAGFRTPVLVVHGEQDYRVPVTQGLNLYGVLTAKGVPARLVVFPRENHHVSKPQGARLWWSEVLGWLDRWLA